MPFIAGVRAVGFTQSRRRYPAFIENLDALVGASFVRRDGTLNLTGAWDVGDQDIVNIAQLGVGTAAPGGLFHVSATGDLNALRVNDATGDVFIGTGFPTSAKFFVKQANPTGAKTVMLWQQTDVSEVFLQLTGESTTDASQSLVDAVDLSTPGSIVGWWKIFINDLQATDPIPDGTYYVPFYSAPTV